MKIAEKRYMEQLDARCHNMWVNLEIEKRQIQQLIDKSEFTELELERITDYQQEIQDRLTLIQKQIKKYLS